MIHKPAEKGDSVPKEKEDLSTKLSAPDFLVLCDFKQVENNSNKFSSNNGDQALSHNLGNEEFSSFFFAALDLLCVFDSAATFKKVYNL